MIKNHPRYCQLFFLIPLVFLCNLMVEAKRPEYHLSLKNHLFYPAKITIPANKKVKLVIFNHDNTAEEFDSFDLNREKVIFPKHKAIIFVGPLPVGEYDFFGEYNPNSARGKVIVVENENNEAVSPDVLSPKQGSLHVN